MQWWAWKWKRHTFIKVLPFVLFINRNELILRHKRTSTKFRGQWRRFLVLIHGAWSLVNKAMPLLPLRHPLKYVTQIFLSGVWESNGTMEVKCFIQCYVNRQGWFPICIWLLYGWLCHSIRTMEAAILRSAL